MSDLPIDTVLPDLLATLRERNSAVLIAPPGAGKTTAVAPALLDEEWCSGTIILLSPRRVAARAAAERIAQILGEKVGQRAGYLTRLDTKRSGETRILVMTEAIFVAQLLENQELPGVSAVLFDEAHERHLDSDLGLALALESQQILRDDLRLLVMSATIDGARFARLLGDHAPVIESEGKAWPLTVKWLGSRPELRVEEAMTSAVLQAWRDEQGDILAFLPGVREIERVRQRLEEKLPHVPILPLHGQVEPAAQRAAIRRDEEDRRRIVLATAIAETSITLEGVSVVVDSGLARRAEFDLAAGLTHLVTVRASQASAAQRAGRAARTGPGVAYRLWEEAAHAGRPAFDPPEIATQDLAPFALALAQWGVGDPASLQWLDSPPDKALSSAYERLQALNALDLDGRITSWGRKIAALPMAPWQAAMLLFGARHGVARDAARLALLMQERGLGGRGEDLAQRLARWNADRSGRATASRKLAEGWAKRAEKLISSVEDAAPPLSVLLAYALPDNVARRRDTSGENWLSAGGRGYICDTASPLAGSEWMVISDAQGQARGARITAGLALSSEDVEQWLGERIERRSVLRWANERVEARVERRLGAITMASGPDPDPDSQAVEALLLEKAVERLDLLVPAELMARARFVGLDAFQPDRLEAEAQEWLAPALSERRDLKIPKGILTEALLARLDWNTRQTLDRQAPRDFTTPVGTHHRIDYAGEGAPSVEVRVQALFGLDSHPMIGRTPLLLNLTSPAGRPIQATRDLPGFWRGSWRDVCKDMRGRYPKHRWPEEPWAERPSLKTKKAFDRS
ncbi:ATP-dependent helicase HrpB [Altericroceibacterium spongiae]|uniref:RNA helicase n=1 Tax=Altericroceibacterium spongiae TaxID=2320269 RepID=A0A420EKG2_9SPHN|nr:ATP-dependent helicase HrpB [Altericroceibacterium spongiae]RKF21185.1 ATP-dependent helicase HrpB [Altericroceibacterium spongiae]